MKGAGDKPDVALAQMLVKELLKSSGAFAAHDAASGQANDAFVDVVSAAVARSIDLRLPVDGQTAPSHAASPWRAPRALAPPHGARGPQHDDVDGVDVAAAVVDGHGRVSSDFGPRVDPFTHRGAFHHGVDVAAPLGTPIHAARDGVVVHAGPASGYGNLIEVEGDDGVRVRYGHADHVDVRVGDVVHVGDAVGTVGNSGRSTGPHVHVEVRDAAGDAIDPETALFIDRARRPDT